MHPLDSLIARARAAMNLLLLATLVSVWAVSTSGRTRLTERQERIREIVGTVESLSARLYTIARIHSSPSEDGAEAEGRSMLEMCPEEEWALKIQETLRAGIRTDDMTLDSLLVIKRALVPPRSFSDELTTPGGNVDWVSLVEDELPAELIVRMTHARSLILEFEKEYEKTGTWRTKTIEEMAEKLEPDVAIPALNLVFPASRAVTLIALGANAILLYLLSVAVTMVSIAGAVEPGEGIDWLFFHQSKLGFLLGFIWTFLPSFVVLVSIVKVAGTPNAAWYIVINGGLLLGLCVLGILTCRHLRMARGIILNRPFGRAKKD